MESVGGGEVKIPCRVTVRNERRLRLLPFTLKEHLVLPVGAQPKEMNLKVGKE